MSGPKPSVFAFGNAFQISGSTDVPKTEVSLVQKYGLIYGTYAIFTPTLTVADPEAIKQILIKVKNQFFICKCIFYKNFNFYA